MSEFDQSSVLHAQEDTLGYFLGQYPEVVYQQVSSAHHRRMDKFEKRRQALIRLRDERCDGKIVNLARKLGREPSYVARMLYPAGKAGRKRIGDDMVDIVEAVFPGWLEGPPNDSDAELWDQVVWLWKHADEEIKTMFRLLVGAMYLKKHKETSRKKVA